MAMALKKTRSINELAQLDQAYGRKLTKKRQFKIAVKPAIITALFSFVLLGVVGTSTADKVNFIRSSPEYQHFLAVDQEDATTYLTNIKKSKNPQYWTDDMPSADKAPKQPQKDHDAYMQKANAYQQTQTAVQRGLFWSNLFKSIFSLWREAIFFIIGLVYGWLYVLPKQIKMEYNMSALRERNAAINILTQSFADTSILPLNGLQAARDNVHGKLRDDFRLLTSTISKHESTTTVLKAFQDIRHEYADDVQFDLFMEQVATYIVKGDISQKTFTNIMRQHNNIVEATTAFQQRKAMRRRKITQLMYMTFGVGLFVSLVVSSILGHDLFVDKVWGGIIGFGGAFAVAGGTLLIYSMMMKLYFDNDLMSL
jgi:hypothetical protein